MPLHWSSHRAQVFPLSPAAEVIWITNPHNPSGQLWSRESLEPLLTKYKLVVCDEAFLPLVPNGEAESLIPVIKKNRNLIVLRSLTKLFAIAGLRLGYAISTAKRLQDWQTWRDPWPLNGLASEAGSMIMSDHLNLIKWTTKVHQWLLCENPWLHSQLNSLSGIQSHPSSTNFQLIEGNKSLIELGTLEFHEILAHESIHVAQSCFAGSLKSNPIRLGMPLKFSRSIEAKLSHPAYGNNSIEDQYMEQEAYTYSKKIGAATSLLNKYCGQIKSL